MNASGVAVGRLHDGQGNAYALYALYAVAVGLTRRAAW